MILRASHRTERLSVPRVAQAIVAGIFLTVMTCVAVSAQAGQTQVTAADQTLRAASNKQAELLEAKRLLEAGRLEEAESLARRSLKAAPGDVEAHTLLGVILDQRGQPTEAEQEYREALRLD